MRPLGLVQDRARVLGQVRVKELGRLRNGQAQIVEVLQHRLELVAATAEDVPPHRSGLR